MILPTLGLLALAAAAPHHHKHKHFNLKQVAHGPKVLKNGPAEMVKAYAKYGKGPVPDEFVQAAAAVANRQSLSSVHILDDGSGSVTATPESQYDQAYISPVSIGTQTFNLDFDTGSSDLWVFSNQLSASEIGTHPVYNPSSTASQEQGETWSIGYGDGSGASGIVYADTVDVGGVTATSLAVEAATSLSAVFTSGGSDGLLGLGFADGNQCSPNKCTTFLNAVSSSLSQSVFTSSLKHSVPGEYDFGIIDPTKYTGEIAYTPIDDSNTYWKFTLSGYSVADAPTVSKTFTGIADTGTTLLLLDEDLVEAYYGTIPGANLDSQYGAWVYPCSTAPDLSLNIGDNVVTVAGDIVDYQPLGNGNCYGGIQPNTGIGFSILGDIFLKDQFVVWDFATPQIGFACQA